MSTDVRHPGETNPDFRPVDACLHCGSIEPTCVSPGCVHWRWGVNLDHHQDRREDY